MKDWVWIVAGGIMQVPYVLEARRRGFQVLVTDRNIAAPACQIADAAVDLDTYDIEGHIKLARSLASRPAAVIVAGADVGPTGAALADYFGLPSVGLDVAIRARDKTAMRMAIGLPHPVFLVLDAPNSSSEVHDLSSSAASAWQKLASEAGIPAYPCVVKPADNCGTRGQMQVRDAGDFPIAIARATAAIKSTKRILIEEYLTGWEAAYDWFAVDGQLIPANGAKRLFHERYYGIEVGHVNPCLADEQTCELASIAAQRLGVTWGPFKTDFIYTEKYGPCILECATRLSGGFDHMYSCPVATGKDVVGAYLDMALGLDLDPGKLIPKWDRWAAVYAPELKPGEVARLDISKALNTPGLERIFITKTDRIEPLEHCAARAVFVLASGNSEGEAIRRAVSAAGEISVHYREEDKSWRY